MCRTCGSPSRTRTRSWSAFTTAWGRVPTPESLLPRLLLALRVMRARKLDARLVQRGVTDVDPRRLVEGAVGGHDVLARDRLTHGGELRGDATAALGLLLLGRLEVLAQLRDLRRLRLEALGRA